ncbi:MAG: phosphoribosylglycinamide formyltransferase [Sideroxydans sp.]|nr:phosphoribosylglycinamide formyltransferase [Sideroxydans sp.]
MPAPKNVVILISGRGSNMEALLRAKLPCRIAAVISNKADAQGLETARQYGVATAVVSHRDYADREAFDAALAQEIDRHQPDFIVLAGFMRILTDGFVQHYMGRMINIHPSLLPAYAGVDTHARALHDGVKIHGCSVHFVTPALDGGPIIIQAAVPVLSDDTPQTLSARVLREEHRIFPQALRWLCRDQARLDADGRVSIDRLEQLGTTLISPGLD